MAFLEGRTLSKKIADGPLKLPEALSIAIQMAEGLEAAHEKGIVHRDIKPDNVMLMKGSRGLVKLMDFGLAQLAQSSKLTREGTTLGTPIYMSPEQALGESTGKRADVWALGVVLYEMVAGRPPFQGEVDQAVIYSIANEPHEPLTAVRTGVPKELERIVDKCLAQSADERYQHVTDLLVDLQACRRSMEPQAAGPTPLTARANTTPLFVGIAALVVACRWVVPVEGGEATELGISSLFEAMGIRSEGGPRARPHPTAWLADDNRVLFSAPIADGGENIWQVRLAPGTFEVVGGLERLTSGVGEKMPSAAANGLLAFVSSSLDWDTWTLPIDANRAEVLGEPERVISGTSDEIFPSISDDGRYLTYVSDRNGNRDIWLLDLETDENKPVTMSPREEVRGSISPSGERIAFVRREGTSNELQNLYVMNLAQETETLLAQNVGSLFDWMPDGQGVFYYTPPPLRYMIVDEATRR